MRTRNIIMALALVLVLASASVSFARGGFYGNHDRAKGSGQHTEQMHRNGGGNGNHMNGQRMNGQSMNEQRMDRRHITLWIVLIMDRE